MAIIKFLKKPAEEVIKKGLDKIYKRTIKGAEGSPFELVDNLGAFPVARNVKDLPGTEIKKLKMIGEKLKKSKKDKKLIDQSGKIRGGLRMGGRIEYKSGSKGCKLAMKGKGRAYGKNS